MALPEAIIALAPGEDVIQPFTPYAAPVGIAGWSITFTARTDWSANGTVLFELSIGTGVTITDPTNDLFQVAMPQANTMMLLGLTAPAWDVWRTDAGSRRQLRRGVFSVISEAWPVV